MISGSRLTLGPTRGRGYMSVIAEVGWYIKEFEPTIENLRQYYSVTEHLELIAGVDCVG